MQTTTPPPPHPSDRSSVADDDVLRSMYANDAAALRAYVRRFTSDAQADDIVQETFIRAWRHLGRLKADDRAVRPWLMQVARNLLTDAVRYDRRRPTTIADDRAVATIAVDGGLDRVLDQQILAQALKRLPAAQLAVLVESWVFGASLDAAAEQLGIPAGTARSRMHYAMRTLREQLVASEQVA